MRRVGLLTALLLLASLPARAATVRLAWDPSTSPEVTGYRVEWGPAPGVWLNVVDAPGQVTTRDVFIATPGRYFFIVRAYSDTAVSAPSNEVSTTLAPVDTSCDYPLGSKAIAIFITALQKTGSGGAGSKARIDFQIASPASPVTRVAVRTNGVDLRAMTGAPTAMPGVDDLAALAGLWFTVPAAPATYALSVAATNAYGCSREQSSTFTVTVK